MTMHKLEAIVATAMRQITGKPAGDDSCYIVALSGGPDSVALLRALVATGFKVEAAHCNFHLRGSESDRDEAFCQTLCRKLGIPLHIVHFDTHSYATLHKVSIEMAARDLRYHYFAQLCHDIGAAGVCIAHHSDDQVETVLLNIVRGTGLKGLLGMQSRNGIFLRPMLGASEAGVMDYLSDIGQDYVIDSTNLEDDAQRNKLRLSVIPMLEKINPAVKANILRMTENLADVAAIVGDSLSRAADAARIATVADSADTGVMASIMGGSAVEAVFDMPSISRHTAPLTLLWHILEPYGFNRTQTGEVADGKGGNREWQSKSHTALLSHDRLYIVNRSRWERPLPSLRIPEAGLYRYVSGHLRVERQPVGNGFTIPKERFHVCIDADKAAFPLTLRATADGDRLTPFGMGGSKLVGDYLKDRKRSIIARHVQLVLTDAAGRIVWLVGETIDDHYKIRQGKTTTALAVTLTAD